MARFGKSERDPPRAFSGYNEHNILGAIRKMAQEQRHMAIRHITMDDLLQLFVPAGYRHSVREAFNYARPTIPDQTISVTLPDLATSVLRYTTVGSAPLKMVLRWDWDLCKERGFFTPGDGKVAIQPDAPIEAAEKLSQLYLDLTRITWEFGLVRYVFNELNCNGFCNTPQQMRFVWPAIRHLVDKAGMSQLGRQLVDASPRAGDKARVPAVIADYMVQSVNIVARTLITEVDITEHRDFKLGIDSPHFVLPNGRTFIGMV